MTDTTTPEPDDDEHVCKPDATTYYCPTAGETESDCHGGFDVCCDRTQDHQQLVPCSAAVLHQPHNAHPWQLQPGMDPVYCEGGKAPAYTWAESVASTGTGDAASIEIDINAPGQADPVPVEVPLADARTLHAMLGDVIAEHDGTAPEIEGRSAGRMLGHIATKLNTERAAHEAHRLALSEALGLGTSAPWNAITEQAGTVHAAARERADLLEEARDALEAAGQTGAHGDDWPAIAPAIRKLAADLALMRGNDEVNRREASNRRQALAGALRRGPGADWYAIRAAAAEYVRRANAAEADRDRLSAMLAALEARDTPTWRDRTAAAEAALKDARRIAHRLAAHALGFQDALDETDRDPWARTVRADLDELRAVLGDDQPAEAQHTCPDGQPCPVPAHDECSACGGYDPIGCPFCKQRARDSEPGTAADATPHVLLAISSHLAAGAKLADALRAALGEQQ